MGKSKWNYHLENFWFAFILNENYNVAMVISTACCYYSNVVQTLYYNNICVYCICRHVYRGNYLNFIYTAYFTWTNTTICATPCDTNEECTAPNTCTCMTGWTGCDCLTGILN